MASIETIESGLRDSDYETATFGMGCFWGPEARFGSLPGVLRTRVGYAGGTAESPTYRQMGDHTETVEVDYDPNVLTYEDVLRHFWRNHYPNRDNYKGRQYISLLRFHDEGQKRIIEEIKKEMEQEIGEAIETEIGPYTNFTLAEERHQKYYLKRYPKALEQLKPLYPESSLLIDSTFAARLNGFVKGYGNRADVRQEIADWKIEKHYQELLIGQLMKMKW
ncbi:peptide-methionine (S)-S-oxide reductase MsrA [Planococcus salinus]|uniref:Peptide methionine sulfoxide reductase MsrA n=1 Tax=Planococcus salinus TaxID=1848460 RepID=A0A3M8PAX8_9BACL|nr:peptide-methionine (S)-S-oxide reductase MsrA [Planococcus salinus]RNF40344.1 peptide-methionine (S)-S-oxide reductase [Planococcus salinus]